jgi:hypothetical protein
LNGRSSQLRPFSPIRGDHAGNCRDTL